MEKKRILFVTQEMQPYTALTEISQLLRKLPQHTHENGMEIRILMPRYGVINERRHKLHEVVRLSGMNIIVDDDDFPLIIKVASLPGARLQVYFLDNDDFFKRKSIFEDKEGKPHVDNADRMVFFCKGVIETVKKFGWAPDIIHCHGWMSSLVPAYVKKAYANEPLFQDSKILYSVYNESYAENFQDDFFDKASINNLEPEDLEAYVKDGKITLHEGAIKFSDALITGAEELNEDLAKAIETSEKPYLDYQDEETYLGAYLDFYQSLMSEEEVES